MPEVSATHYGRDQSEFRQRRITSRKRLIAGRWFRGEFDVHHDACTRVTRQRGLDGRGGGDVLPYVRIRNFDWVRMVASGRLIFLISAEIGVHQKREKRPYSLSAVTSAIPTVTATRLLARE